MSEPRTHEHEPSVPPRALGGDLIIPAVAGLFALYFLWDTWGLKWEARINGILISVPLLALIAVRVGLITIAAAEGRANLRLGEIAAWTIHQRQRLLLFAVFLGLALSIGWVGVTLGLFLALLLSLLILGNRSLATLALVPTGTAAFVYVLFIAILDKRMPHGPIEDLMALVLGTGR